MHKFSQGNVLEGIAAWIEDPPNISAHFLLLASSGIQMTVSCPVSKDFPFFISGLPHHLNTSPSYYLNFKSTDFHKFLLLV